MFVPSPLSPSTISANLHTTDLAHRISSNSPSREFMEKMRRLDADSKVAQEVRMLLGDSVQHYSLPHASCEAQAFQMRLRHLMVKEQILDTLSTDPAFTNQVLGGIRAQYEGTDLQRLAEAMVAMRGKVMMLERALGLEGEKMTPEEMKNKVAKSLDWENYVTAAGKKSAEAREVERREDAERLADHDGTDHTAEEPSAASISISNPASSKPSPNQSDIEIKEDRKKQQAKLKKAIDANRLLQAKLRQVSDNRNRWSEYCEHLQKKLERSNALLKEHQVAKELVNSAEPEEGGPSRPQTVEREEAVIDVFTPERENYRPPAILSPAEQRPQSPHIQRPEAGAPRQAIQILPPNAKIWRDNEDGRLPPLLVDSYEKHSASWKDIGSSPHQKRGPRYSEDHSMARGGLHMAECSTDALEALEMVKPGESFVVDDKMREVLRTFKHPSSGDSLAALHAMAATQEENNVKYNPIDFDGDRDATVSAESEPGTSAKFINQLAAFQAHRGMKINGHVPRIGSKHMDLQALYRAVTAAGGFDQVSQDKLGWQKVATRLGLTDDDDSDWANSLEIRLKTCYYRLLAAWEIKDMHGKEPPPKQMLEDSSMKGADRLARVMMGGNPHPNGVVAMMPRDVDVMETLDLDIPKAGTPQPALFNQSAIPPESASEPPSPKLPRLLHTTTVPDSLASSSSVSQHHTSSTQAEHPTSGADTINAEEANHANAAAVRPPPSDDKPPIVVYERNIRKRKHNDSPPKKKIKQERIESSPIALLGLRHLHTQESMDLDDIGPKTATPKKRREKQCAADVSGSAEEYAPAQIYPQAPSFTSGRHDEEEDEDNAPDKALPPKPSPGIPTIPLNASSVLKPRSTNPILPRTSAKTYPAKRRRISDKGADLFSEDGENHLKPADAEEAEVATLRKAVPRTVAGRLAGLLEKPSPRRWQVMNMDDEPDSPSASDSNFTAPPIKPSTKSAVAPRQAVHERLAAQRLEARKPVDQDCYGGLRADRYDGILDLAELAKSKQKKAPDDKRPEAVRINPSDCVDMSDSRTVLKIAEEAEARSKKALEEREAKHAKEARERGGQRQRQDVLSTARSEKEPLATRPVSRLSLDDFRINPEYNNGLDYAYRDVVRGREKRKCLAGCTDTACCGKGFRALAEIATPIRDNSTPAQKEEEDTLLTEFLGRDAARLIRHMGKEERRDTLIKAKTRELANKHGKHRHAYERRKSPPGFWRADFPTTQEEAEDREKAKLFERDLVQRRYEEAMRGSGKWIFKDRMGGQPERAGK